MKQAILMNGLDYKKSVDITGKEIKKVISLVYLLMWRLYCLISSSVNAQHRRGFPNLRCFVSVAKREMEEADARREARRLRHCYETPRSVGGATSYSAVMQEKQKAATSAATGLQIQVMDIPITNSVLATEWLGWAGGVIFFLCMPGLRS